MQNAMLLPLFENGPRSILIAKPDSRTVFIDKKRQ